MKNLLTLLAVGASAIGMASAQGYFGAHIGVGTVTDDDLVLAGDPDFEIIYDDGVSFGFLGGYSFSQFFAGELEIVGQSNDSEFFQGEETYTVTSFFANAVVSTPSTARVIFWAGAGAGFASTNIEEGGNSFATQLKAGAEFSVVGPHYVGLQASWIQTDSFEQEQDGIDYTVDYANTSYGITYKFRF